LPIFDSDENAAQIVSKQRLQEIRVCTWALMFIEFAMINTESH